MIGDQPIGLILSLPLLTLAFAGGIAYGWSAKWRGVAVLLLIAVGYITYFMLLLLLEKKDIPAILAMQGLFSSSVGRGLFGAYFLLTLAVSALLTRAARVITSENTSGEDSK